MSDDNEALLNDAVGATTGHWYFDEDGKPISLEQWARRYEDYESRVLVSTTVGDFRLATVWLGYVDPEVQGARLFGTALLRVDGGFVEELETYDSKVEATIGHARHFSDLMKSVHD